MTLIEAAIRKMQGAGQQPPRPAARSASGRGGSAPPAAATESAKLYRPATLDLPAMERNLVVPQVADDIALNAYKILRTRLLQRMASNQWFSLAVTATLPQQGKTLTAVNLAMTLAQDPHTFVYLVDLDLRRPQVANTLGMSFEKGIGDYLLGEVEADQVIYESGISRLAIIPNARPLQHSSELLSSRRMLDLIKLLVDSQPRRIIVCDMPPMLFSDDVIAFAPQVDGILLVATEGTTTRESLKTAKALLAEMNLIGVILNRSSERSEADYY
jgi:protein-tyrosine kinase